MPTAPRPRNGFAHHVCALALMATFALIATDARAEATTHTLSPRQSSARRIGIELATSSLGMGAALGVGVSAGVAADRSCRSSPDYEALESLGLCQTTGQATALWWSGILGSAFTTLGTGLVHHYRGGSGRWWVAMLGSFLGMGAGVGAYAIGTGVGRPSNSAFISALAVGGLVMATMPVLLIEVDHRSRSTERTTRRTRLQLGAAPTRSGFAMSMAGRF